MKGVDEMVSEVPSRTDIMRVRAFGKRWRLCGLRVRQAPMRPDPPLSGFWLQGPKLLMRGMFSKWFREKTVDRSSQVYPSPFAAQGMTDGLVERRCSGHMNHEGEIHNNPRAAFILEAGGRTQ